MACPFPPAFPQHRKQCWRNFQKTCARRKSESDILPLRAGCAPRPIPAKARGGPRRPQKVPGGPRKAPGILRRPQEAAEEPHAPDELVSEKCAPRFSGSKTFRKHVRGAKARATFCPFAWGVRRVPLLPRILRRGREDLHVEKKHIDFVLFFAS